MSCERLGSNTADLAKYDVVGEDGYAVRFVKHLGLCNTVITAISSNDTIAVAHIELAPLHGEMRVHVVGSVNLTADEAKGIDNFRNRHVLEQAAESVREMSEGEMYGRYVLCPHAKPVLGDDGETIYIRFSCAGFVLEAYRWANINLVNTDLLPLIDHEKLTAVFPGIHRDNFAQKNKEFDWGLDFKSNKSPLLMPGYILHSLDRSRYDIGNPPYEAQEGDELFAR